MASWVWVAQSSEEQSKMPSLKSILTASKASPSSVSEGKAHPKGHGGPTLLPEGPSAQALATS